MKKPHFYSLTPCLKKARKLLYLSFAAFLFFGLGACVNVKKATYFNDAPSSDIASKYKYLEPVLKPHDILSITVSSLNPKATEMFNMSNLKDTESSTSSGKINRASGFLVDDDGYISFPVLGKIKAAGKTKNALQEEITQELINRKLLLEPIVAIRYLNFRVSVLGEVKDPSVLTIPSEKVTLMEALSLAGDLTIYAKRENVLLIREEGNVKKLRRIDLTTDSIFTSPYYYLKPNDIIYVQPNKSKIASTSRISQWLPIIISSLSLAIIALDRFL